MTLIYEDARETENFSKAVSLGNNEQTTLSVLQHALAFLLIIYIWIYFLKPIF